MSTILVLFFFRSVNLLMSIIIFIFILNFFPRILYQRVYLVIIFRKKNTMTQSKLSEFFDALASYKQGFKAKDVSECLYKIHDDSVRPRHFLSVNNADEIEAILL